MTKCRVYDTLCINPRYCDERDACCAGDMNCKPDPDPEYVLALKRSLFELIELCKLDSVGLGDDQRVRQAKELIRCSVQGCGLGGACNGKGLPEYPCPLSTQALAQVKTP